MSLLWKAKLGWGNISLFIIYLANCCLAKAKIKSKIRQGRFVWSQDLDQNILHLTIFVTIHYENRLILSLRYRRWTYYIPHACELPQSHQSQRREYQPAENFKVHRQWNQNNMIQGLIMKQVPLKNCGHSLWENYHRSQKHCCRNSSSTISTSSHLIAT